MIAGLDSLRLRGLDETDHEALREVWCGAWETLYPAIDFRARWPDLLVQWQAMVAAGGKAVVADWDGIRAGFMVMTMQQPPVLEQIVVANAFAGRGVARSLMAEAKSIAGARLALTVNKFNSRAIAFYEHEGFARIGEGVNATSKLGVLHYEWRRG